MFSGGQGGLWGLFAPKQLNEGLRKRGPPAGRGMIPLHPHSAMIVGRLSEIFPRETLGYVGYGHVSRGRKRFSDDRSRGEQALPGTRHAENPRSTS